MNNIHIRNGRLLCPRQKLDQIGDLYIQDDKIIAINNIPDNFHPDKIIDATNCWVLPGLVDLSVAIREPGYEHKGNIDSESNAAIHGGVTTICTPPNTNPVIDSPAVVELITDKAERTNINIYCIGALTYNLSGSSLSEMAALKDAGCIAVTNWHNNINNTKILRNCFNYAASFDLPIYYIPCDSNLALNGCAHESLISFRYGLKGISYSSETIDLARAIMLQQETGVRLHIGHISCAQSVSMVEMAQAQGAKITADVVIHQLMYTEENIIKYNSNFKLTPPLRTEKDRLALVSAIEHNIISAICSDHCPHETSAKQVPFAIAESGISGVQTLLLQIYKLHLDSNISILTLLNCVTNNPANIIGKNIGTLQGGSCADICIFNPSEQTKFVNNDWKSKGKNSPLLNSILAGKIIQVLSKGKILL